jgi:hypothetical protein
MNYKRIAAVVLIFLNLSTTAAYAQSNSDDAQLYKCPGSNAHVWNKDQCPSLNPTGGFGGSPRPYGGGGSSGNTGIIGRIVDAIGGILG